jgi:putative salt-induced outer membrane protein
MQMRACLICASLASLAVMADEAPPPQPQGVWVGKGQLGFLASQGNSTGESINGAIDMGLLKDPWEHKLHIDGYYGKSEGVVSSERWAGRWQSDYTITTDWYAFGALLYQRDLFSGFQYQASQSAGVGYKLINSPDTKLSVQAGAGYREQRPEELTKLPSGAVLRTPLPTDNSAIFTAGLDYSQAFTSTTTLSNKLLVEVGSGNTLIGDILALTVKMNAHLALSLGLNLQENTSPPAGVKKVNSAETANLVFSL